MKNINLIYIIILLTVNICCAENKPIIMETSFDEFNPGPFKQLKNEYGTWETSPEQAEIDAKHSKSKKNCLHILGGVENIVEFIPADKNNISHQLSFWAERWTSRDPFKFRVEVFTQGKWKEIYNGDKKIRVGRSFLSQVVIDLPEIKIEKFRFICSAPPNTGILVDDLMISVPSKMIFESVNTAQWITPVLVGKDNNPVLQVKVQVKGNLEPLKLTDLSINTTGTTALQDIDEIKVFYTGTSESFQSKNQFGGTKLPSRKMGFHGEQNLEQGTNYFWISCKLKNNVNLSHRVDAGCEFIMLNGNLKKKPEVSFPPVSKRIGIALRKAGDDGSKVYRIPGLATTNKGTLIAVYDIRYNGGGDLPNHIDIGMSRSTDGGQTWEPMKIIMDMGNDPQWRGDGIGDPSVLVDRETNTIWVAALWSHGNRGWHGSGPGMTPDETGQLMLVKSEDDGKTWSQPINITRQVKEPKWRLFLQGPGKGITLRNGTLVFPAQFKDENNMPHSTIIYSKNHGQTWHAGTGAKPNTTESQVVELNDGSLMLNMRDNRGGSRSVYVTKNLGETWTAHSTSRKALPEPVCMASLISFSSIKDGADKNLLMFSNPNSIRGRHHITIKVSEDEGMSWPKKYYLLLDERSGAGYSCMTVIDENHVGILYEGSQAHLTFEKINLKEIIREN